MRQSTKQLRALHRELGILEARRPELCRRIGALYNDGRDGDSFDRAFELWQAEFQPLLADIEQLRRNISRLTPPTPGHRVNGRSYPRKRRVI